MRKYNQIIIIFVLLSFILLSASATYAWYDTRQHSSNIFYGNEEQNDIQVILNKYAKDRAGNILKTLLPDAEFYLYRTGDPDEQIGEQYKTDEYGQIIINEGLSPGSYYFVETGPPAGYTYDEEDGEIITNYPFDISGSEESGCVIITAYNRRITADLTISKKIEPEEGIDLTQEQREEEFEFVIIFSDGGTYLCRLDDGSVQDVESGTSIFLKHGQTVVMEDLPYGIQYRMWEVQNAFYHTVSRHVHGTIGSENIETEFINTPIYEQGGSLEIYKQVISDVLDQEMSFAFIVTFSDGGTYRYQIDGGDVQEIHSGGRIYLKHGQTARFIHLPAGISYQVEEEDYHEQGYLSSNKRYGGVVADTDIRLDFYNYGIADPQEYGGLRFTKKVKNEQDTIQEYDFQIFFSEEADYEYLIDGERRGSIKSGGILTIKNDQTIYFPELPHGITYTVSEINVPGGYEPVVGQGSGTIIGGYTSEVGLVNWRQETSGILRVKKAVKGEVPETDQNKSFEFVIIMDGEETIFHLQDSEVKEFVLEYGTEYEIYERDYYQDGYVLTPVANSQGVVNQEQIEIEFINTYVGTIMEEITGEKTWDMSNNPEAVIPDAIYIYLKNGQRVVEKKEVKPDKDGRWTYSFMVPRYEADQETVIHYTIEEEEVKDFTTEIDGFDIVNRAKEPAETKTLEETVGNKEENSDNSGNSGNSVKEESSGRGSKKSNRKKVNQEMITLKGSKYWDHSDNAYTEWPAAVTILVKNGDKIVVRREITVDDHWSWHFELEKYDKKGNEIYYEIDEEEVKGYGKYIEGYDIYNSYGLPDGVKGESGAQTGDDKEPLFWLYLLLLSALVMGGMKGHFSMIFTKLYRWVYNRDRM